jgi:Na+-transporting NADH:ubiquinone oxidoreductase subunit F
VLEIGLGVALFVAIVACLVTVVLVVRSRVVITGRVALIVNDERVSEAEVGTRLLGALADAGVHLPSACGGVGTCGQCLVRVLEGGGAILPIETVRITKRQILDGMRLACQVMVRQDTAVRVPEEIFGVKTWQCAVTSNRNVATFIKELVLHLPEGESMVFRAGAYIQVACPPYRTKFADIEIDAAFRNEWNRLDLWRYEARSTSPTTRAYSMANYPGEGDIIVLNVRIALPPPGSPDTVPPGVVSSYLFSLKPGDKVTIAGPYGHFFATESQAEMVFVGGGAGMAPMRSHIYDQLTRLKSKRKMTFWYGARGRRDLFYVEGFDRLQAEHENFQWFAALSEASPEDDWAGKTGFIHEVLYESHLKDHPAPEDCEYYLCGPPMMLTATRNMLDNLGVDPENIFFDEFGV